MADTSDDDFDGDEDDDTEDDVGGDSDDTDDDPRHDPIPIPRLATLRSTSIWRRASRAPPSWDDFRVAIGS